MTDKIIASITGFILGGVVISLFMNWLCDKMGWFK